MGVYRGVEDLPQMISNIRKEIEEMKTRQFIGSNQLVMRNYKTANTWDLTVTTSNTGQTPDPPYWNTVTIDAEATADIDLVADIYVKLSYVYTDYFRLDQSPALMIPLPVTEKRRMKWVQIVFGDTTSRQVSIKPTIISNADVTIQVRQGVIL